MTERPCILAINGGSSSIKFALFQLGDSLQRILDGMIDRIGLSETTFTVKGSNDGDAFSKLVSAPDHAAAVGNLVEWLEGQIGRGKLKAVGHRVVHGGQKYTEPQQITPEMIQELRQLSSFDPEHLPGEIELIKALIHHYPDVPQVACFDTAFHRSMPRVARLLPIPRRYDAKGIQRYGFHGLSYAFLMEELARLAGAKAARGKIVLAHLGKGASLACGHQHGLHTRCWCADEYTFR
jgi:acetate kinase